MRASAIEIIGRRRVLPHGSSSGPLARSNFQPHTSARRTHITSPLSLYLVKFHYPSVPVQPRDILFHSICTPVVNIHYVQTKIHNTAHSMHHPDASRSSNYKTCIYTERIIYTKSISWVYVFPLRRPPTTVAFFLSFGRAQSYLPNISSPENAGEK